MSCNTEAERMPSHASSREDGALEKARGHSQEEQPHLQRAVAARAQEGLEKRCFKEGMPNAVEKIR